MRLIPASFYLKVLSLPCKYWKTWAVPTKPSPLSLPSFDLLRHRPRIRTPSEPGTKKHGSSSPPDTFSNVREQTGSGRGRQRRAFPGARARFRVTVRGGGLTFRAGTLLSARSGSLPRNGESPSGASRPGQNRAR